MNMRLRDYQQSAVFHVVESVEEDEKIIALSAPVGSGKSLMILASLSELPKRITKKIIVVPQSHIGDSFLVEDSEWINLPSSQYTVGKIIQFPVSYQDRKSGTSKIRNYLKSGSLDSFLVTTHQSLARSLDFLPSNCEHIILYVDEAHHMSDVKKGSKTKKATLLTDVAQVLLDRGGTVVYVTATPIRGDGKRVFPEDVIPWNRSIADQCAEGFAPKILRHEISTLKGYKAKTIEDVLGETVPEDTGKAEVQLYDQWVKDGKPKTVLVVPSSGCDIWVSKIVRFFESKKVRIFNAVGPSRQKDLGQVLETEKCASSLKDSKIDIILACKRFDEGTDWPLCSHVYQIGMSKSLRVVLQRWGRALRLKYREDDLSVPRFSGMKKSHRDTATFRFFLPEGQVLDLGEELWEKHRDYVVLLACHMHCFETGQQYAAISNRLFRGLSFSPRRNGRKRSALDLSKERAFRVLSPSDLELAEATKKLFLLKEKVGIDFQNLLSEIGKEDWGSREKGHVYLKLVEEVQDSEIQEDLEKGIIKVLNSIGRKSQGCRAKNPLADLIVKGLEEQFSSVSRKYEGIIVRDSSSVLSSIGQFTGIEAQEISEGLRNCGVEHDIEKVKEGIHKFVRENGKPPSKYEGDASLFVGYPTTWRNIDGFLFRNGGSLCDLYKDLGYASLRNSHDVEKIKKGIHKFVKENKKYPNQKSGDSTLLVGYQSSWSMINNFLRKKGSSLSKFSQNLGYLSLYCHSHSLEEIKKGIRLFQRKNNVYPNRKSGDATNFVGYKTTWSAINGWLKLNCSTSLPQLSQNLGFESRYSSHTLDGIKRGVNLYFEKTGNIPTKRLGDCSMWLKYSTTWKAIDHWLRNRQHSSLHQLCKDMGLK